MSATSVKILVAVEGYLDIEFLRRISRILHHHEPDVPDLGNLESQGQLIFFPVGGDAAFRWVDRLAPLGIPEIHILDREREPLSQQRMAHAQRVNERPGCRAFITNKRAFENYLHGDAIWLARGIVVQSNDFDDVPELVADQQYGSRFDWGTLSRRQRRRIRDSVKRWLCTEAVNHMTSDLLLQRDPRGEVRGWLRAIADRIAQ